MIKNYFKTPLALIALMSMAVTGCVVIAPQQKNSETNGQQKKTAHALEGEWLVITASDTKTAKYGGDASLTLAADGKANGRAVVNGFFADYVFDGKNILFSHVGATKMAGPEEDMKAESAILQAINDAKSVVVNGDQATVYNNQGKVVMTLEKK